MGKVLGARVDDTLAAVRTAAGELESGVRDCETRLDEVLVAIVI